MIELSRRPPGLHIKQIWFEEQPHDVVDCDVVHFYCCKKDVRVNGFSQQPQCTIVIDLSQSKERIWGNISPKTRSGIRKAKGDGIIIQRNQEPSRFLALDRNFRTSRGLMLVNYPTDFIRKNCLLLTVEEDEKLIAGILLLVDGSNMLGLLAASGRLDVDREKASFISNINKLLWWEAIRYGLENGVIDFDMGGYDNVADRSCLVDGVSEFKRRFGGQVVHYFHYEKVYSVRAKVAGWGIRHIGNFNNYFYKKDW